MIMNESCRTVIDESYLGEEAHKIRWKKTLDFLKGSSATSKGLKRGLDLGCRTPLTDSMERLFSCPFDNTSVDLDTGDLEGSYDIVTAFEVLEHLFNPLHAMLEVGKVLMRPGGRFFVSMPLLKPQCLASPGHFHEMSRRSATLLFHRAGFSVERKREFRIREPLFYLTGVKPLMRAFYEKVQIYELFLL